MEESLLSTVIHAIALRTTTRFTSKSDRTSFFLAGFGPKSESKTATILFALPTPATCQIPHSQIN
jgi:hypothetical protein